MALMTVSEFAAELKIPAPDLLKQLAKAGVSKAAADVIARFYGTDAITFTATNHDELTEIVRRMQDAGLFPPDEAAAFAIGLKLFGETMLLHRDSALFTEMRPHFMDFMKKLKASLKDV